MKKALLIGGGLIGAYLIYRAIKKGKKDSITESAIVPSKFQIVGSEPLNVTNLGIAQGSSNSGSPNVVKPQSFARPSNPLDWTSGMVSQYIDEKAKPMPLNIREPIISAWITFAGSKKQASDYITLLRTRPEFAVNFGKSEFTKQVDAKINEWGLTQIDPKLTSINIFGSRPTFGVRGL
jgi:hypothetical protein